MASHGAHREIGDIPRGSAQLLRTHLRFKVGRNEAAETNTNPFVGLSVFGPERAVVVPAQAGP